MAIAFRPSGGQVEYGTVAPLAATSGTATAVVSGSEMDMTGWRSLAYTISVITHDVDWSVFGANDSSYSDEVAVQSAATVAAATSSSYVIAQAPYAYYRVKIIDSSPSTHGVATVRGIAKG
jgi:hypothetical protein